MQLYQKLVDRRKELISSEDLTAEQLLELDGLDIPLFFLSGYSLMMQSSAFALVRIILETAQLQQVENCNCEEATLFSSEYHWLHNNHSFFNRAVWELIHDKPCLLADCRTLLNESLAIGEIPESEYAHALADGFFVDMPDESWVGKE